MGLDPGLRATGWGIIDAHGNQLSVVANGTIRAKDNLPLSQRLHQIFAALRGVLGKHGAAECAIEETFVNKNPSSTLKLGHARAAAILAAAESGLPVFEYSPTVVKKSVVGSGRAEKDQVSAMVKMLLPGAVTDSTDASDALAVAICHAHHRVTEGRLVRAGAGRREP